MARPKIRLGNTGPQRKAGSRLCIPCAYKKCKSQLDVKNVGSKLKVKRIRVQADKCRTSLRAHSKWVRFCCERHRDNCLLPKSMVAKRGPREPLDAAQLTDLFHVLIRDGAPWAAVAALLCMSCGERAGCIVKAKFGWLQNLSPAAKDLPCIGIEKVNGKTKPRNIPLPWELARLLHKWIHEQPLVGGPSGNAGNSQWPFEGQSTSSDAYMFPSATVHGLRLWDIAIGRQGFHKRLTTAADIICRERAGCRAKQQRGMDVPQSVWENYNFSKLGTHSLKRSSVTLMKEVCKSTALVGSIAGTSAATCDRYYDYPTTSRQKATVDTAFEPVLRRLRVKTNCNAPSAANPSASTEASTAFANRFCASCGQRREHAEWVFCPRCGRRYDD